MFLLLLLLLLQIMEMESYCMLVCVCGKWLEAVNINQITLRLGVHFFFFNAIKNFSAIYNSDLLFVYILWVSVSKLNKFGHFLFLSPSSIRYITFCFCFFVFYNTIHILLRERNLIWTFPQKQIYGALKKMEGVKCFVVKEVSCLPSRYNLNDKKIK